MLHIDSLLLDAFYDENKDFLQGAKVQKIQQPTRREIVLHLRKNGESRKLYININPQYHHLSFMSKETDERRNIETPKQPPMFCMLLRKHMEGAKIIKAEKPDFERILELSFENYNEIGDRVEECLSIELMGKHSNIVLYNTDNNIIIGCAHNIGEEKSKERELAGGLPYIYPPKQDKKNLLQTRFDWFSSALSKSDEPLKKTISLRYFALSQVVIEEICTLKKLNPDMPANEMSTPDRQILYVALHEFLSAPQRVYSVSKDYEKYSCLQNLGKNYPSVNALIDDYYSYHIEKNLISNMKTNLNTKINKELKKLLNTYKNQEKQLDKKEKAQSYMLKGNLLTANAYMLKNAGKSTELMDYETGNKVLIELDETLNTIDNAKRYFDLYSKTKKAYQVAEEMSVETKSEIEYYEELLFDVNVSTTLSDLKEIAQELGLEKTETKQKKNETVKIEKREIDEFSVYIGKNNKQNDYLYSKISSPNDMWFHVLNMPGSHVIAKAENSSQKLKDETILKIAELAKEFSTAKNSAKTPVTYTLRKYVKRPQNTNKKGGFVVYKNETEIVVN